MRKVHQEGRGREGGKERKSKKEEKNEFKPEIMTVKVRNKGGGEGKGIEDERMLLFLLQKKTNKTQQKKKYYYEI